MDDGTVSPVGGERRLDVQGLRAVAVLMVVVYHAWPDVLPGGFVGVDVFFVISGFVITLLLEREWRESGRIDLRRFYTRRVRRILPALAVTILAVAVGCVFIMGPLGASKETAATGLAASTLWANVQLWANPEGYFTPSAEQNALLHTWSLSVEEQFYLLFPWLMVAAHRLRRVPLVLGVAAVGSLVLSLATTGPFAFYWTPARAWEFIAGALVALAVPWLRRIPELVSFTLGLAGLVLIATAAVVFDGSTAFPGTAALYPVAGTVALLVAGTATPAGVVPAVLSLRPLVWIGDLSYGWYLWHWPALVFGRLIAPGSEWVAVLGSLGLAWVSYRLVENPVRHHPRLIGRRVVALAAGCVAVPALAAAVVPPVAVAARSAEERAMVAAVEEHYPSAVRGCDSYNHPVAPPPEHCWWRVPDPRGAIALLGDSNAGQFSGPVTTAGNQLGYDVLVIQRSVCQFTLDASFNEECDEHIAATVDHVADLRPALVVLASSGVNLTPRNTEAWTSGLVRVLDRFTEAGIATLMVHQVPFLVGWDPATCQWGGPSSAVASCIHERLGDPAVTSRTEIRAVENAALDAVPAALGLDVADMVCPERRCRTRSDDGLWVWRDGDHLTADAARTLTPRFVEVLTESLGAARLGG